MTDVESATELRASWVIGQPGVVVAGSQAMLRELRQVRLRMGPQTSETPL